MNWSKDAAWKLHELLLGSKDVGLGESHGCVVPFDCTMLTMSGEDDDNGVLNERDRSKDDLLSLCLEALNAAPRIIHHDDCTGKVITKSITQAVFKHPLIEFVGDAVVMDLSMDENGSGSNINGSSSGATDNNMVSGSQLLNKQTNQLSSYYAVHGVVLASGGLAGIYQHSTNPLGFNSLGSSVNLALRLEDHLPNKPSKQHGVVSDLEYV